VTSITWSITDNVIAVLLLAAIIVAGQFPSRHEPKSPFLARQRWPYRDVIIVLCLVTVIGLVPPSVLKTMEIRAWAMEGVFTLVIMEHLGPCAFEASATVVGSWVEPAHGVV
jgi:hypothetical protein